MSWSSFWSGVKNTWNNMNNVSKGSAVITALNPAFAAANGIIDAGLNAWNTQQTNDANMAMNQANIDYQKQYNRQQNSLLYGDAVSYDDDGNLTFDADKLGGLTAYQAAREDSAVQRHTADVEAAGFSKLVGAGTSAAASQPLQSSTTSAPQNGFAAQPMPSFNIGQQVSSSIQSAMQMAAQSQALDIQRYDAETRRLQAEAKADIDKSYYNLDYAKAYREFKHDLWQRGITERELSLQEQRDIFDKTWKSRNSSENERHNAAMEALDKVRVDNDTKRTVADVALSNARTRRETAEARIAEDSADWTEQSGANERLSDQQNMLRQLSGASALSALKQSLSANVSTMIANGVSDATIIAHLRNQLASYDSLPVDLRKQMDAYVHELIADIGNRREAREKAARSRNRSGRMSAAVSPSIGSR